MRKGAAAFFFGQIDARFDAFLFRAAAFFFGQIYASVRGFFLRAGIYPRRRGIG